MSTTLVSDPIGSSGASFSIVQNSGNLSLVLADAAYGASVSFVISEAVFAAALVKLLPAGGVAAQIGNIVVSIAESELASLGQ